MKKLASLVACGAVARVTGGIIALFLLSLLCGCDQLTKMQQDNAQKVQAQEVAQHKENIKDLMGGETFTCPICGHHDFEQIGRFTGLNGGTAYQCSSCSAMFAHPRWFSAVHSSKQPKPGI